MIKRNGLQLEDHIMQTVTIGIPSFNEINNMEALLNSIISGDNTDFEILEIIISDDSTDGTQAIVENFSKFNQKYKIRFFHHDSRRGAATAWNEIISHASGNIIVLYDADVIPERNCTKELVSRISNNVGICASNPKPIAGNGLVRSGSIFTSKWLESVRTKQLSQYTVMGRGLALRSNVARKANIPPNIIAIDLYLQNAIINMGYEVVYNPDAVVHFKPASTLEDFASQAIRASNGHRQIASIYGKTKHRLDYRIAIYEGFGNAVKDPFGAASVLLCCLMIPYYRQRISDLNSSIWHTAASTKNT
ncbi:MAG: glycosyltransferase [Thermoproteota archaeon]|nr:glycosyltransferase [Thermoproteota archaeon]